MPGLRDAAVAMLEGRVSAWYIAEMYASLPIHPWRLAMKRSPLLQHYIDLGHIDEEFAEAEPEAAEHDAEELAELEAEEDDAPPKAPT